MDVEAKYYADGEDAYAMKRSLEKFRRGSPQKQPALEGADAPEVAEGTKS